MQTILGANGAIGIQLAKELSCYTKNIRLIGRDVVRINKTDQIFSYDLNIRNNVYYAIEGSEIVYVTMDFPDNIKNWDIRWLSFVRNVVRACKLYKVKLVFFDNTYMYDKEHLAFMDEHTAINPCNNIGRVQEKAVQLILNEISLGELDALIARAPDSLCANSKIIGQLVIQKLKIGKTPLWFINPEAIHNFIYPPDAAKALAILGNTPSAYNDVWHLPSLKEKITGREWGELISKHIGYKKELKVLDKRMLKILGMFVPAVREVSDLVYQYETDYYFDSSKFEKEFGFKATHADVAIKEVLNQLENIEID